MQLFIDANIFLSFYRFSSDDLEQLQKLAVLVKTGRISLLLPEQVVEEFLRNREATIAEALIGLRRHSLGFEYPRLAMEYREYAQLRELEVEYKRAHTALIQLIADDAAGRRLKADSTVRSLFDAATQIAITSDVLDRAELRSAKGNPPGKKGSIGDAINWEVLLESAESGELHFVSADTDYVSPLNETELNGFLMAEWKNAKGSAIVFYRSLTGFLRAQFPDIQLSTESEVERVLAIKDLVETRSFQQTHKAIQLLATFKYFSTSELNQIAKAAITNDQIERILSDRDVFDFLTSLVAQRTDEIEESTLEELRPRLAEAEARLNQ